MSLPLLWAFEHSLLVRRPIPFLLGALNIIFFRNYLIERQIKYPAFLLHSTPSQYMQQIIIMTHIFLSLQGVNPDYLIKASEAGAEGENCALLYSACYLLEDEDFGRVV